MAVGLAGLLVEEMHVGLSWIPCCKDL